MRILKSILAGLLIAGSALAGNVAIVKDAGTDNATQLVHFTNPSNTYAGVVIGGISNFTDLVDTPASYAGAAGQVVAVKAGEDGLEFISVVSPTWGAITGTVSNQTDLWAYITNRYTKAEIDSFGFLTSESDPVWTGVSNLYYLASNPNGYISEPPLTNTTTEAFTQALMFLNNVIITNGYLEVYGHVDLNGSDLQNASSIYARMGNTYGLDIGEGALRFYVSDSYATGRLDVGGIPMDFMGATSYNFSTNVTLPMVQFTGGSGDQGKVSWNADEETLDLICNGAVLQMGQELYWHVRNDTAHTLTNGMVVYSTGTIGGSGRITADYFIADGSIPIKYLLGVTTEEIGPGDDGKVTAFGKVRGIDTSAFDESAVLYCSATVPGGFTTNEPAIPNQSVPIAYVVTKGNNGTLAVRTTPINDNQIHKDIATATNDLWNATTNWVIAQSYVTASVTNNCLTNVLGTTSLTATKTGQNVQLSLNPTNFSIIAMTNIVSFPNGIYVAGNLLDGTTNNISYVQISDFQTGVSNNTLVAGAVQTEVDPIFTGVSNNIAFKNTEANFISGTQAKLNDSLGRAGYFLNNSSTTTVILASSVGGDEPAAGIFINQFASNKVWIAPQDKSFGIKSRGDIIPADSNAWSLGSASAPWKDIYVGTNSLYVGGVPIRSDGTNIIATVVSTSGVEYVQLNQAGGWTNLASYNNNAGFVTSTITNGLASIAWVEGQGYLTEPPITNTTTTTFENLISIYDTLTIIASGGDPSIWFGDSTFTITRDQAQGRIEFAVGGNDERLIVDGSGIQIPDGAYGAGWNGSLYAPTRNAIYDQIETLVATNKYNVFGESNMFTKVIYLSTGGSIAPQSDGGSLYDGIGTGIIWWGNDGSRGFNNYTGYDIIYTDTNDSPVLANAPGLGGGIWRSEGQATQGLEIVNFDALTNALATLNPQGFTSFDGSYTSLSDIPSAFSAYAEFMDQGVATTNSPKFVTIKDSSGGDVIDMNSYVLVDGSAVAISFSSNNRTMYKTDGTTITLDYQNQWLTNGLWMVEGQASADYEIVNYQTMTGMNYAVWFDANIFNAQQTFLNGIVIGNGSASITHPEVNVNLLGGGESWQVDNLATSALEIVNYQTMTNKIESYGYAKINDGSRLYSVWSGQTNSLYIVSPDQQYTNLIMTTTP